MAALSAGFCAFLVHCDRERYVAGINSHSYGTLWLSQHVYLCRLHSTVIALDLARDSYLGIAGPTLETLAAIVPGWPDAEAERPAETAPICENLPESISELIAEGILTIDSSRGKRATPVCFDANIASVALIPNVSRQRHIRIRDIVNFLWACLSTAWLLKCRSLQKAVEVVSHRSGACNQAKEFAISDAADLIAIFRRLRSFTFSAHHRCLFHSLVLVSFLSRYGLHPQFVIGVKVDPWAAHSWVQFGRYVLDGTPEQVRFYTPILAI